MKRWTPAATELERFVEVFQDFVSASLRAITISQLKGSRMTSDLVSSGCVNHWVTGKAPHTNAFLQRIGEPPLLWISELQKGIA